MSRTTPTRHTTTYAYDPAGRSGPLTSASWPASHPGHEATGPRTYHGTTITRAGGIRYEPDALGRVTLRQKTRLSRKPDTWRYEWDAEDRLTCVITPGGTRWHYLYDPLGLRTAKQRLVSDGETVLEEVRFTWDGTTLCEQTTVSQDVPRDIREFGVKAQGAGPQLMGPSIPKPFDNSGKNGAYRLPELDSQGNPIRYTEWGTVQSADNPKWGGERIVTGSAYYTPTHYQTYIVMETGR